MTTTRMQVAKRRAPGKGGGEGVFCQQEQKNKECKKILQLHDGPEKGHLLSGEGCQAHRGRREGNRTLAGKKYFSRPGRPAGWINGLVCLGKKNKVIRVGRG